MSLVLGDGTANGITDCGTSSPLITRHTLAETVAREQGQLLLVEDNPINQKVAAKLLEKMGYRVDVTANGAEALEALRRIDHALVFMDCRMPEMVGSKRPGKFVTDPRRERPSKMPIIAMTANALQGDRERCLHAVMDDYLCKPLSVDELRAVLDRWLPTADPDQPTASAA